MRSENRELLINAAAGDRDAFERLVAENAGLVRSIAKRFVGRGADYEDLCQIGHIGMIKAIKNFDASMGTQFSTYAVPLIIGEIRRFLRDDGDIKVSRELKRRAGVLLREKERFFSQNGVDPTVSELASACGLTDEEAVEALSASGPTLSFSEPMGETTVEDHLGIDFTSEQDEKIALRQAVDRLEPCERQIILLRYYKGLNQTDVGRIMGMSQVTVSRREAKALAALKEQLV